MKRTSEFAPHAVQCDTQADGTLLLYATGKLSPVARDTGQWLAHWANNSPQRIFLAERDGAGWREETYASTLEKVHAIAASLLERNLNSQTPILIMSGNGIDHALLSLAAHYVGIPTVPVAEQYSLIPGALVRLQQVIKLINPAMAYVVDAQQYAQALSLDELNSIEVVASRNSRTGITNFDSLLKGSGQHDVDNARASNVNADTVVKILMTSGSTSQPKGVLTTNKMLCANQAQIADALPFLRKRPPRLVDWLPWNHVFGGSHNFYMMLANGGSLYIDDGKPAPGLIERTIENLGLKTGTLCFNVPAGFQMLLSALQKDKQLQQRFFADLDLIFYAGASLPQSVWEGFETMAMQVKGEVPLMTSSWGLTETAPATLMQQEPIDRSGVVGVPLHGVKAKLIPESDNRFEVRVKGPNIMPGYFNEPDKTRDAFDEDGFFITGDAMTFVDRNNPTLGLRFDGRLSEDFKLLSGTWVRAAQLRLAVLARLAPYVTDVVITGADRNDIGLLIFPNKPELEHAGIVFEIHEHTLTGSQLFSEMQQRLAQHAQSHSGSSTRIARAMLLAEPASIADGEITAKGNLNFRQVLNRRAALLERLYNDSDVAVITL